MYDFDFGFAEKLLTLRRIDPKLEKEFMRFVGLEKYYSSTLFKVFMAHGNFR